MISNYLTGLQHIGIPVVDLEASISFYEALGFQMTYRKGTTHNGVVLNAAFMDLKGFIIELYQMDEEQLEDVMHRQHGHIDHFALDVTDIEAAFDWIKAQDFYLLDKEIQSIDFYENGVRYFRILGPSLEIIEFNGKQ